MLLKSADSKDAGIAILTNLLNHRNVSEDKKQQISRELRNVVAGVKTEKEAAYEVDFHFGASKNMMVLHDLRIEVNGRVAQIDHLLINRLCEVYVLETKTFSTGLSINDRGEFSTTYDGRKVGIASPIEQNARHIKVLRDAFKLIGMPKRLGITIQPSFRPVILVSQKAVIERPNSKKIALDSVIKLDQFFSWYNKQIDETKAGDAIGILKLCSGETVKELGEKLVALHKPVRIDYVRKFDVAGDLLNKEPVAEVLHRQVNSAEANTGTMKKTGNYFCAACQSTIAEVVAKFCWNSRSRFGGKAYCRSCQSKF